MKNSLKIMLILTISLTAGILSAQKEIVYKAILTNKEIVIGRKVVKITQSTDFNTWYFEELGVLLKVPNTWEKENKDENNLTVKVLDYLTVKNNSPLSYLVEDFVVDNILYKRNCFILYNKDKTKWLQFHFKPIIRF